MTPELKNVLDTAKTAAESSAEILLNLFGKAAVRQKSTQDLVTEADIESEERITAIIHRAFPDHTVLREEGASTGNIQDDHLWVIDPLDATNNYAHGIPHFSVSIGYAQKGAVQVGVILDPLRREMFTAVKGHGALLNDRPMRVSSREGLPESIIATGFYYDRGLVMERTLDTIRELFYQNIRGIRRTGGAALDLSWVACGRFEGFFEYKLAPWDYAAGSLIVQEAGGICTDRGGNPLLLGSGSIIAGNRRTFERLRQVVVWREGSAPA